MELEEEFLQEVLNGNPLVWRKLRSSSLEETSNPLRVIASASLGMEEILFFPYTKDRSVYTLFADADEPTEIEPSTATWVVKTARGFHYYWTFETGASGETFDAYCRLIASAYKTDTAVCSYKRGIRLPGTWNRKTNPPTRLRLERRGERYKTALDALDAALAPWFEANYTEGIRHEVALHFAGAARVAGLSQQDVEELLTRVCTRTGDKELGDRIRAVQDTFKAEHVATGRLRQPRNRKQDSLGEFVCASDKETGATAYGDSPLLAVAALIVSDDNLMWRDEAPHVWTGTMWKRLDDRRFSGVVTQKAMTCSLVYENGEMPGEALVMLPNRLRSLVDVVLARLAEKPAITEAHAIPTESVVITENLERTTPDRWYGNTALFTMTGSNTGAWREFIVSVFPDEQTAAYAQTLIGAAAFGFGNVLQKMLWLVGPPATGKSTFAKVLHHAFGGYSASINIQEISEYDIARVASRRLVIANEADGRYVARIIKQLTSGDTMRAREIYGRPFDVEFNGVIVATSNEYPRPYDVAGMVRRFVFVEFNNKPEKTDEMLPAKLSGNTAEVIDWVADGFETFQRWQRGEVEVAVPESVKRLSTAYERWTDQMKMFIDSKLVYHKGARTQAEEVYEEYRNWCRAIDHQPRAFGYNWLRSLDQNGVPLDDTGACILDFRLAGV